MTTSNSFDTSELNYGLPLFDYREVLDSYHETPDNALYTSYQEFAKTGPRVGQDKQNRVKVALEDRKSEWEEKERVQIRYQQIPDQPASLEELNLRHLAELFANHPRQYRPFPDSVVVLGLDSIQMNEHSLRQLYFLKKLLTQWANIAHKELEAYAPQSSAQGWAPLELWMDNTHWTSDDQAFVKSDLTREDYWDLHLRPFKELVPIFNLVDNSEAGNPSCTPRLFIIAFRPMNPVRQMLADFFHRSLLQHSPPVILCAPCEVDNTDTAGVQEASGDRNSDTVIEWLGGRYQAVKMLDEPNDSSFKEAFGELALHLDKDLEPSAITAATSVATGNTPPVGQSPMVYSPGNGKAGSGSPKSPEAMAWRKKPLELEIQRINDLRERYADKETSAENHG